MSVDSVSDAGPAQWGRQLVKAVQAASYICQAPLETLRWAHHCDQRRRAMPFEVDLEEVFPGIFNLPVSIAGAIGVPGEAFDQDLLYLALLAKYRDAKRLLEIGTFFGRTSLNLAYNTAADAHVYTVDDGQYDAGIKKHSVDVGKRFRGSPVAGKITQLLGKSQDLDLTPYGPFDFIFIDADHSYDSVRADTLKCLDLLEANGIMLWHDYALGEGVTQWLDELRSTGLKIACLRGSILAMYLKE